MSNKLLCCPECSGSLSDQPDALRCSECGRVYPVQDSIARFVPPSNYAGNFGFQWNKHARTQLDRFNGTNISRDRFYLATSWSKDLRGQNVLEAGCGAGRFTQVAADTGATLISFDLSTAVDAARANTEHKGNVTFLQADMLRPPLVQGAFDKVFCFGVLQHTPNPRAAFLSLARLLKPGGELVIDVYDLARHRFPHPKYWIRPVTKRMSPRFLHSLLSNAAPALFPVKRKLKTWGKGGRALSKLIPLYDYTGVLPLDEKQLVEWAVLDTLDGLAPRYEYPQTEESVQSWFDVAGLVVTHLGPGPNGIVARGHSRNG